MSAKGDYYPRGANMFVRNMGYAADVGLDGKLQADLGILNAASAALILSAQSIAAAGTATAFAAGWNSPVLDMGKFGRCLQYVASGAATSIVTTRGFDYLGQPMSEQITLNGSTIVTGLKAFRFITSITWALTAGTTINVGTRDALGLPYAMLGEGVDYNDPTNTGALVRDGTQGTFTAYTFTQTVSSSDPRGLYTPNASFVPNAARRIVVSYEAFRTNLYGNAHFTS